MQLYAHERMGHSFIVSILTRPGGRVQPMQFKVRVYRRTSFNPHPSRRTGATSHLSLCESCLTFQSSPVPEDGCNLTSQQR